MMNRTSIGIRRFQPADIPELFLAARESIAELRRWMVWCGADYNLEDSSDFVSACDEEWEADRRYSFAIYDRRDGALLGSIGLSRVNRTHRCANVGYWVRSSCTGRGIASAGLRQVAQFAFEELHLNRLELVIALGNLASMRVAEKVGARRADGLRRWLVLNGQPVSAAVYSLMAQDLLPNPSRVETGLPNTLVAADLACALS